jgi:NADP-dependent 3-hydroxy acid dehydrogenase YdfG
MTENIEGKVVAITGASSGLGKATARRLASEGAALVLGARRKERIEAHAREFNTRGGKAIFYNVLK